MELRSCTSSPAPGWLVRVRVAPHSGYTKIGALKNILYCSNRRGIYRMAKLENFLFYSTLSEKPLEIVQADTINSNLNNKNGVNFQ